MERAETVGRCRREDLNEVARLRAALWPGGAESTHRRDLDEGLYGGRDGAAVFGARSGTGDAIGFVEASLRRDHVNECATSPVAFLEGVDVLPAHRRRGEARKLCAAVEAWAWFLGRSELGSDAALANAAGHAFHLAPGFEERERVASFRKERRPGR